MNREKTAWTISIILIAILAFWLPGSMAQRDDDYAFVRTLVDIHRQVLQHYAENPDEQALRAAAIDGLLEKLDPYSIYVPPSREEEFNRLLEGSFTGVGIQLDQLDDGNIEVVTPIDGSPAFKAGVMAGDIIQKVNGESVEGERLDDVVKKISGRAGTEVTLTVKHLTGEEQDLTITRQEIVVPTLKGYQRTSENEWDWYVTDSPKIAYVRITQFTPDTYPALKTTLEDLLADDMKGLILDLRFNPGGRLDQATQVVDLFLDEGVIVSTRGRNRPEQTVRATVIETLPYFPMIVLVNEYSASAAEIVAGSLLDNQRALVMGQRTYGKGSVQEVIPLDSNGGELKLTVAYYYLPSGRLVHKKKDATDWGVQPQIVVPIDPVQEQKALQERYEHELFKRPIPKMATQPSTSTTSPSTQPADVQLQRAVDTMIGLVVLQGEKFATRQVPAPKPAAPAVQPVKVEVAPATAPQPAPASIPASLPQNSGPQAKPQTEPASIPATQP